MFYALPAETVFEAKQRTKRATVYLFIILAVLYVVFFNLMLMAGFLTFGLEELRQIFTIVPWEAYLCTALSVGIAVAHFFYARSRSLDDLLDQMGTRPADPRDSYHSTFINLVQEAEAATGIHGIRAIVLPSPGCNAFSLQDGRGQSAIGATEGLLSKLNRQELSAVVAHEAAHLVHEDSRLVTTACFLFGIFGKINTTLSELMRGTRSAYYDRRSSSRGGTSGFIFVLWLVSGVGYVITKLVSMAISREREYLADADGVAMCKDPLALAESLYKISRRYRGDTPETYSSLFILNPTDSVLDDQEGFVANLFSNHPPLSERLGKLLGWARSDLVTLQALDQKEEKSEVPVGVAPGVPLPGFAPAGFMAYQGDQWAGPFSPAQLLALGSLTPTTWVCPAGSQQVSRASDLPELLALFQQATPGTTPAAACPRCKVPLTPVTYEGAEVEQCGFCRGYLLRAGVLERLISREEVAFSPEDIKKAKVWRDSQRGPLKAREHFPEIRCPHCQNLMGKGIHSMLTQVVIDHCTNEKCGAIWCDGGELETIQMIIQDAHAQPVLKGF
ncbi:MAG TPA: zinc metalloprotease HtpX [bacterium]|nr:zinc metalloprotease HtpX [bacterium]